MEESKQIVKSNLLELLQSVVIAIAICVFIYLFIATPNQIDGQSMEPTFMHSQIVLTSKVHQWLGSTELGKTIGLNYQRGDVVVFQKPGLNDFIKRVIAIPGDSIQIKTGKVYVNSKQIQEPYLPNDFYTKGGTFLEENADPIYLKENEYFLMGDNRNNSRDSRYIDVGVVKRDWIKGKVLIRYWPLNQIWVVEHKNLLETE